MDRDGRVRYCYRCGRALSDGEEEVSESEVRKRELPLVEERRSEENRLACHEDVDVVAGDDALRAAPSMACAVDCGTRRVLGERRKDWMHGQGGARELYPAALDVDV